MAPSLSSNMLLFFPGHLPSLTKLKVRRSRAQSRMPAVPTLHGTGRCRTKLSPVGSLPVCISVGCSRIRVDSHSEPEKKKREKKGVPVVCSSVCIHGFFCLSSLILSSCSSFRLLNKAWYFCGFPVFSCRRFFTSVRVYIYMRFLTFLPRTLQLLLSFRKDHYHHYRHHVQHHNLQRTEAFQHYQHPLASHDCKMSSGL
jgi:hypothetical protein